ncbi:MAG: phenylalanine--tRNA ligase subunit alpha [Deltaproteobacteria bacterium]|nr:phenylalanine--tRNA ligase subunit alpha [Deltaproteobacteria bacterium]
MGLIAELEGLTAALQQGLDQAVSLPEVEALRVAFMGRKGRLAGLMARLKEVDPEDRPAVGQAANAAKQRLAELLEERIARLKALAEGAEERFFDPSMPGRPPYRGSLHPVTLVMNELCSILEGIGYEVVSGPEAETDFHNFAALNFPKDHPARDMQDTLYLGEDLVMRTHTSPMQVRSMLAHKKPPLAVLAPGKVYRRDFDLTHTPMFHQVEGLLVGQNISLGDLRGTLAYLARELFGPETRLRFRPSFFPFTEPSAEVDLSCMFCGGSGRTDGGTCRVCKGGGWLEILGSGMVDPNVFKAVGFPEDCSGFAFGLGVERIAMLKYGIGDLRMFFENDARFLERF